MENLQFDSEYSYSILLYGGGAVAVLWLASAVVSAVDSIPLVCMIYLIFSCLHIMTVPILIFYKCLFETIIQFPKLLEVVGLGYTLWFTTRYLLFKVLENESGFKTGFPYSNPNLKLIGYLRLECRKIGMS